MAKATNKQPNDSKGFQESLVRPLAIILIFFSTIILAIFIGDIFDLENTIKIHLRYDWAMILCTFMSAIAAITLGVISIVQNKRLSELNEKSLETAKINNGYSLIHFRDRQFIEQSGKQLKLKLYDTKNIPLKSIKIKRIQLQHLEYVYKEDEKPKIVLTNKQQTIDLKFTPINPDNKEDFYFADIEVDFPFADYTDGMYLRLEFDMEVTNVLGVTTTYEYYVLNKVFKKEEDRIILENYYEFNYCKDIKASNSE